MTALHINGNDLTLAAVREVAVERRPVLLSPDARESVHRARAVIDALVAGNQMAYAITTGVGKLSDVRIVGEQIREMQVNLVRSHAAGVGQLLSDDVVRAMMLLLVASLARGLSGVRPVVAEAIVALLSQPSIEQAARVVDAVFAAEVAWGGTWRAVLVSAIGNESLLGMRLLAGHKLVIEVVPGGLVEILPFP